MSAVSLSLITPTFNSAALLPAALASVDLRPVEHLLADGGSTDGTLALVQGTPGLQLLPGPDRGIYDALNKGIFAAQGEIIGLLNSDDRYPPGALAAVLNCFALNPDVEVVSGAADVFVSAGQGERVIARHDDASRNAFTPMNMMREVPIINARFFRRRVFDRLGGFSLDYPLGADRELLIRWAAAGVKSIYLPQTLYQYRAHEGSRTLAGTPLVARRLAAENLTMAEAMLAQWQHQPALRAAALAWHRDYIATDLVAALRLGAWPEIPAIARRAARQDSGWFWRMPAVVQRKLRSRRALEIGL